MMNHKDFADAVVNAMNKKEDWFIKFQAARGYHPRVMLKKVQAVKVIVAPVMAGSTPQDDAGCEVRPAIDIGIVKRLSQRAIETGLEDNREMDPLMDLADQVEEFFNSPEFDAPEGFRLTDIPDHPTFMQSMLEENRQFTRVFRLNFEAIETPC